MKKLITNLLGLAICCLLATTINGQIRTPAPSPGSELKQTVGLTEITVNYSRPAVKGRTIFAKDGLVPYGKIWRTGANAATKITFSDDVKVGGKEVKAGSYAMLTIPSPEKWVVNLYTFEAAGFGSYVEKEPTVSVSAESIQMEGTVENFLIDINDIKGNTASIWLIWDKTVVGIPMEVEVDKPVMASIERTLAGPRPGDYYSAATYYHESGKDLNKALEYIKKANDTDDPKFWQVRREALILADLKKKTQLLQPLKNQ